MIISELARPVDRGGDTAASMSSLDAAGYWRAIMDVSPDAIVVLSGEGGRVLQASRSFLQLLGYSLTELECLRSGAWDASGVVAEMLAPFAGNFHPSSGSRLFESRMRRKDSIVIDVEIGASWTDLAGLGPIICIVRDITRRKAADRKLRESEAKFRAIFDNTKRGIGLFTADGRHIESNPVVYAVSGARPGDVVGRHFWEGDWWSAEDKVRLRDAVQRAGRGEYVRLEVTQIAASGQRVTGDFSIAPIIGVSGDVIQLLIEANDVTAFKDSEAELARREQLLSAILKQTPGSVVLINERTHQMVEFNDFAFTMHGYSSEEFAALTVLDLKADATPDLLQQRRHQTISEGLITFEDRHRRKDGSIFDVRASLSRIHVHGEFHTVALWVDVSNLKSTEQTLREREQEIRTLVDNIPDGMVRYDRDLHRVYLNPAMAKFIGEDVATLVGTTLDAPRRVSDPGAYKAKLQETFKTGQSGEIEVRSALGDQSIHWSQVRFIPEFGADGGVATVLAIARDISEVVDHRDRVQQLAFRDPLTGLPNRTLFNERFGMAISAARGDSQVIGLLILDLDHFKDINDSLGHAAGDELLCQVSRRLSDCLESTMTLARLGGDEFAVIISGIGARAEAVPVADRVRAALAAPFIIHGKEIFASASIGIALCPEDGDTPDELFARADVAMYDAKRNGRGGIRFYAQELSGKAARRLALGTSLHSALVDGEFELFFQPKVRLADSVVIGAEALLRWRHPELGLLTPDAFIGIAEDTGLIVEIGRWVLKTACAQAVAWNAGRGDPLKIAVNLSSRQFTQNDLVGDVRAALEVTGCRPEWLECEITESLILRDELAVHIALAELTEIGISIAIDDFGTGQSALAYLNRFHVDVLKIDRSFVDGAEHDPRKAELVKAFISIAAALEMETVAEGIETIEQAELLQSFGCGIGQGYLLGRPVAVEAFQQRFIPG
jgi:diguanylate cyclase (GGDEF)-like protein/PAS domain S-box-containing protein